MRSNYGSCWLQPRNKCKRWPTQSGLKQENWIAIVVLLRSKKWFLLLRAICRSGFSWSFLGLRHKGCEGRLMLYPLILYPHSVLLRVELLYQHSALLRFKLAPIFHSKITATSESARFVNRKPWLFSFTSTIGAMDASQNPVLWHRCWAWDWLSSTTSLLCSPLDQWSGFSHSTAAFCLAKLLSAQFQTLHCPYEPCPPTIDTPSVETAGPSWKQTGRKQPARWKQPARQGKGELGELSALVWRTLRLMCSRRIRNRNEHALFSVARASRKQNGMVSKQEPWKEQTDNVLYLFLALLLLMCKNPTTSSFPIFGIFAHTECFGSKIRLRSCWLKSFETCGKQISQDWTEARIFTVVKT